MKTTIRRHVFETNSSSEHTFTVTTTSKDLYDKFVNNEVRWVPTETKVLNEEETKEIERYFKYAFVVILRAVSEPYDRSGGYTKSHFVDCDSAILYNKFIQHIADEPKIDFMSFLKKEIGVSSDEDNLFFEVNDDSAETFMKYLKMKGIISNEDKFIELIRSILDQLEFGEDNYYSAFNSLTTDFGSEYFIDNFLDALFPKFEVYTQLFSQSDGSFEKIATIGDSNTVVSFGSYYEKDC